MKLFFIVLLSISLLGCADPTALLNNIPNHKFENLSYTRTGNFTYFQLDATKATRTDTIVSIESVDIKTNNPLFSANVHIEGYEREIPVKTTKE